MVSYSSVVINNIRLFSAHGIDVMSYDYCSGGVRKQKNLVEIHKRLKKQIRITKAKSSKERQR